MEKSQGSFPRKAACHSTTEPRARALAVSQLQLLIQKHLLITCCVCQAQEWGLWRGIQTKLDMELPPSRRWEERREKCRERERDLFYTNTEICRIHCIPRDGGLAPHQHRLLGGHKPESRTEGQTEKGEEESGRKKSLQQEI